jgi:hypothetical protein
MKRGILLAALLVAAMASPALAQSSVEGRWRGTISGSQGDRPVTVTLEADSTTLTGTVSDFQGGQMPIENGSVRGDTISFHQTFSFEGQSFTIRYVGQLVDDELAMVLDVPEMGEPLEFILRRTN